VYHDLLVTVRDMVATLKKQARSLTKSSPPSPPRATAQKWSGSFMSPAILIGWFESRSVESRSRPLSPRMLVCYA
jgi:hypothetical protein